MLKRGLLLLLFFASGSSGLVYELVWIRQFGTLFGSSIYSAAIVTGIYMGVAGRAEGGDDRCLCQQV